MTPKLQSGETGKPFAGPRSSSSIGHNSGTQIELVATALLSPNPANPRRWSAAEEKSAARIIKRFGPVPLVVDADNIVLVGELALRGARRTGLEQLPVVRIEHLTPVERNAMMVAYGRLGELGKWDSQQLGALALEFEAEILDFTVEDIGFAVGEIDIAIGAANEATDASDDDAENPQEDLALERPVSVVGDVWLLGRHRLVCGDATAPEAYAMLLAGVAAMAVFTDPPFGCAIDGFVAGKGRHREFVMASGEMSDEELSKFFTRFIVATLPHLKRGAVVYLVIDWRSLHLLLDAARPHLGKLMNLAVWAKDRAGMGSFYRSQHELILVFKAGNARARNNVMLGKYGRDRSNVWRYPSAKTASKGSDEGNILAHHPTPKPVRMVADALLDCTRRGDVVLDPFLGSGTTLMAAEKVGRTCYGIDLDPLYVDLAIRRWQAWTGEQAAHADTGRTYAEIASDRTGDV